VERRKKTGEALVRYRFAGDRITTIDATAKPIRRTDLSPREELEQARMHLATLENSRMAYPEFPGQHDFSEQREKVRRLEALLRESTTDSAPPPITTIADLNRLHAAHYEQA
jgi:hypothetical protein